MGVIVSVLQWVWNALSKVASLVVTIPGMIVAGITGGYAFVSALFGEIPALYHAFHTLVGTLSRLLSTVNTSANGLGFGQTSISDTLCYFVALDSATSWSLLVLVSTVGLVGFLLIGFIASLLSIVAAMYTIRGTLKAVRIISGGMLSPAIAAIVGFVALSANAALDVQWYGDNQIVVTGIGGGGTGGEGVTIVYTNVVGMCTNCVAVTPDELRDFKSRVTSELSDIDTFSLQSLAVVEGVLDYLENDIQLILSEQQPPNISGLDIFPNQDSNSPYYQTSECYQAFNQWWGLSVLPNPRSIIDTFTIQYYNSINPKPSDSVEGGKSAISVNSYAIGMYDYAQNVAYESLYFDKLMLEEATNDLAYAVSRASVIQQAVDALPEEACTNIEWIGVAPPSGGGDSGGSSGGASSSSGCCCTNVLWLAVEQLEAIERFVHGMSNDVAQISRDVHATTNSVLSIDRNFKQYAESMKSVLLNNASVVTVADSENSWSNVYRSGQSQLYSYNQSNILQRIELLLYGISGLEQSTTNAMPESVDTSASEDITDSISDATSSLDRDLQSQLTANDTLTADFLGLANSFSLFGRAGNVNYEVLPTMYVDYGGEQMQLQSLQIDNDSFQGFQKFATCVRYCFQALYLSLAVFVFYIFWKWVLSRVAKISLWLFDFINGLFG